MKIYFVRHGETDMNARNMFYGWYDADINEKGIAQAEELRAAFETIHIDAIYSSDLKRAYHTAEIIANGREIQPVPEIRELYYGDWENRTWEEMSEGGSYGRLDRGLKPNFENFHGVYGCDQHFFPAAPAENTQGGGPDPVCGPIGGPE